MSKEVFVLKAQRGRQDTGCRGVYTSQAELIKAVDYWMKESPRETLAYEGWDEDYVAEANEWEWCYIPLNASRAQLAAGGGSVPLRKYWGMNLVELQSRGVEIFKEG